MPKSTFSPMTTVFQSRHKTASAIFILLLLSAITLLADLGDVTTPRFDKRDASKLTAIVENGVPKAAIVITKNNPNCEFAAKELQEFIKRSTNAELPVANAAQPDKTNIFLGTAPDGFDLKSLPRDGFIIKTVGKDIYIAGMDDKHCSPLNNNYSVLVQFGTLYGVYGFLERFIGARLLFPVPECEFVKKMPTLAIPQVDILDRPDKIMRSISWTCGWDGYPKETPKINNVRMRPQTTIIPNCHGLGRMGYIERFGKTHPEYFAMDKYGNRSNNLAERMGGQLCFSSNIREEIYQDAKAYLSGVSAKDRGVYHDRFKSYVWDWNAAYGPYFNVMPQDGMLHCQCEACQKQFAANPNWDADTVWQLTADIQNRLNAEGIKGYVTQMAYGYLTRIPDIDIPKEVPVQLAIFGSWGERQPGGFSRQLKLLDDWNAKLQHKVWLWTYEDKYSGRNIKQIPCSTPKAVAHFLKEVSPNIIGTFMESETDKAVYQALNWYIYSKMMWDESIDGEKEFQALCDDFFASASVPMQNFFGLLEDLWLDKICANCIMTKTGPEQKAPSQRELWNDIYSPQVIEQLSKYLADARTAESDKEIRARIDFWEHQYLDCLRKGSKDFLSIQQAKELLDTYIPEGSPAIDGKISDPAWKNAAVLHLQPTDGKPLLVQTEVKVLRDSEFLYIAYHCEEPDMQARNVYHMKHDDGSIWATDSAEIFLAPDTMPGQYIQFMINTRDSMADMLVTPAIKKYDLSYESNAEIKTFEGEDYWTCEVKIPLKSLKNPSSISADFTHSRTLKDNKTATRYHHWTPFGKDYGDFENFGKLLFSKPETSNMIVNADFTMPQKGRFFGPWSTDDASVKDNAIALDDKNFILGGRSLKFTNDGSRRLCVGEYFKKIEPNTKYRLTCMIKIEGTPDAEQKGGCFFMFNDGVNQSLPGNGSIKATMPWTRFAFEFTSRATISDHPYLRFYSYDFNGTVWVDAITMEKIQ